MAPRANWKGFLRLSLVTCPVALYPATSDSEKISFNQNYKKIQCLASSTSSLRKDTIHEFTPYIFVLNFTNMILRKKLVSLQGDEIGRLVANALEGGIVDRRPWYQPADKLPDQPIISVPFQTDFDSLVVEMPARNSGTSGS
jgi:hypothetical protein